MKVYEILSEAPNIGPTTTTPSGIVIPQSAAQQPAKKPTRAKAKPSTVPKKTPAKKTKVAAPAGPKGVKAGWERNQIKAADVEARWTKSFGAPLTMLMRVIGIGTALTQLYGDLEAVDKDFKAGIIDAQELESSREFLFGAFATQMLAPAVIKLTARALMITKIARVIKWLAAGATGAVTGGASVVAAFGTEAFFLWLQAWLGSDSGKNWLSNDLLLPIVKTMGKVPELAWSKLTGYYEKTKGPDGATAAKPSAPGQPAPVQQDPGTVSADDFIKSLK